MLLVNSVSHKISLGEDAPIAFGAPVGWVGIAFGAPVGWEWDCLRRSRGDGAGLPAALPWGGSLIATLAHCVDALCVDVFLGAALLAKHEV